MAIDFPNSPTTGDTYTAGGRTWQWDGTVWAAYGNYPDPTVLKIDTGTNRVGINNTSPTTALDVTGDLTVSGNISGGSITGAGMTVSSTAPSSPSEGEMWYNEVSGRTFVYYDDGSSQQWVEFGVPPNGSKIALASYADSAARTTALPSPSEADLSYLQDTNSVEVYDGSAWAAVSGAGGTYVDYSSSVTFTNFTLGNGTVTAHYARIGDFVHYTGLLIIGSTSSFSGTPFIIDSLPVSPASDQKAAGNIVVDDLGTAAYTGAARLHPTQLLCYAHDETGSFVRLDNIDGTTPMTWVSGDRLYWTVVYRAA